MFDVTMTMFDDEAYCDHMKAAHKAGLPNAGPMAAENCLAANIKQNKVFLQAKVRPMSSSIPSSSLER